MDCVELACTSFCAPFLQHLLPVQMVNGLWLRPTVVQTSKAKPSARIADGCGCRALDLALLDTPFFNTLDRSLDAHSIHSIHALSPSRLHFAPSKKLAAAAIRSALV